jgi:hypothetical protein
MQPYATLLAQDLDEDTLQPHFIPYFPSAMRLDLIRQFMADEDPIWPHHRWLTSAEWKIIRCIDGHCTIGETAQKEFGGNLNMCTSILGKWYVDGFVLFTDSPVKPLPLSPKLR